MTRLDSIKVFIDDLNVYFNKNLYHRLRDEGMSPKEIKDSEDWNYYRKWFLTDSGEEVFGNQDYMDDFVNSYPLDELGCRVEHGAQQIAFIYDDIVYKICSTDIGSFVNENISELPEEFYKLFAWYNKVEYYNNCYIYTQEYIYTDAGGYSNNASYCDKNYMLSSDDLYQAIVEQYGMDFCERFCTALKDLTLEEYGTIDARETNWGYDNNDNVKIFDPFYYNG